MTVRTIELIFFDAGGGHRAAAQALQTVLAARHPDWRIRITDLQDMLKSADPLFILTGVPSQNFYNAALKLGMTYGSRAFLRGLQTAIKLCRTRIEDILRPHWQTGNGHDVDAVISLIPNFNGALFRALRAVRPQVPFVTVMTDMADSPPHFWQENQDQHIVCGTWFAARQARATGWYRPSYIHQTSGMILRPSFYEPPPAMPLTRSHIGFADHRPTAIIMFGGYGSSRAVDIVDGMNKAGLEIQTIVLCGRNEVLRTALKDKKGCRAVGFTDDVASYMRLADFFIGKPGPGSLSEAWHMGLPVIVENNARTMIQERPNAQLVQELCVGIVVNNFSVIAKAVRGLLADGQLEKLRANVRKLDNRAVYEIADVIAHIAEQADFTAKPVPARAAL